MKYKAMIYIVFFSLLVIMSCFNQSDYSCVQGGEKGHDDFNAGKIVYTEYIETERPEILKVNAIQLELNNHGIEYNQVFIGFEDIVFDSIACYNETQNRLIEFYFGEGFVDSIKQSLID